MLGRSRGLRLLSIAGSAAIAGVSFGLVLPHLAPYGAVWHDLQSMRPGWLEAMCVAVVLNLVTFAWPWLAVLPGLGIRRAFAVAQISTAFTLVAPGGAPAGMAVSYGVLRRAGFERAEVGRAVVVTGVWNQAATFAFPGIALAVLAASGRRSGSVATLALIGVSVFVLLAGGLAAILAAEGVARGAGDLGEALANRALRLVGQRRVACGGEQAARFRRQLLQLLRRRWQCLTVATLVNQLTGYLLLELALRAVGIGISSVTVAEGFAAWTAGRLLSSLPVTPGGIGFTEVGIAGTLVAFGGLHAQVVAAVLVYRAASIVPIVVIGGAAAALLTVRGAHR